ncbi:MAG: sensor histidine kinase [Acidiferrobacteraceae bacterium]
MSVAESATVTALGDNLIHLHEWHPQRDTGSALGRTGLLFALAGALLGGAIGNIETRLAAVAPRAAGVLQMAVPALLGGSIGILIAWVRVRRRMAKVTATATEFRRRLTAIERNQALWVSLSAVLHDVRNPLHSVTLLLESLDHPDSDMARTRAQALDQLAIINLRIRKVMDQVSTLSGEIRRHPVALSAVAAEVTSMISPFASRSGIEFRFEAADNLFVQGDDRLLVQALDHLALNSLQTLAGHGCEGKGWLHLDVVDDGQRVCIRIEDNGPGLPAAVQERLFEPLGDGERCGMGLGLAIARALSQAAGGDLDLSRTGPDGTEFRLCLDKP